MWNLIGAALTLVGSAGEQAQQAANNAVPLRRIVALMNRSEDLRQIEYEMERFWLADQPSRLTPERVHGGVGR